MTIVLDFDGTVVESDGRSYDDVETPLRFMPSAREALQSLKLARHTLVIYSVRCNRSLRVDPNLDPLVRAGKKRVDREQWEKARPIHEARYRQMVDFVREELNGIIDAVDDGQQGKPEAQLYIDNNALRFGSGLRGSSWQAIAVEYGVLPKRGA